MVLTDRKAAELRAKRAVDNANNALSRALAENRHRDAARALNFRNELGAAARTLAAELIAIYSELESPSDAAARDEFVAAIQQVVGAFITSQIATHSAALGVGPALRLRGNLISQLRIARDFDLEVHARAKKREQAAGPNHEPRDSRDVLAALWVLESDESSQQGTAFTLDGYGVVTCEHVLHADTVAFRASDVARRFPVSVTAQSRDLDVALIKIDGTPLPARSLPRGSADSLKQLDALLVAGFPNYRFGDTGVTAPGRVIGFRPVSGIRRILTDATIAAGNSGGPVLDGDGLVVGIAVTGSDSLATAHLTENHGIIPIDVIDLLAPRTDVGS